MGFKTEGGLGRTIAGKYFFRFYKSQSEMINFVPECHRPSCIMSIKEQPSSWLKQIALFVYVLDFVFALTQNIFTFGFSHQKLANFVPKWFLSLIDLD